jgi:hypothetical protein
MNQTEERQIALRIVNQAIRHLSKHDVFENAGMFDFMDEWTSDTPNPSTLVWNNDTLCQLMQTILQLWLAEHWKDVAYEPYPMIERTICPPELATLQALFEEADDEAPQAKGIGPFAY